ncbi:MAG TPA: restriction endonuclease subunit S [Roseiflexaceae bacterium]|nr:restriction endonuclease subunit S [Roseiflexaceae bacterium]
MPIVRKIHPDPASPAPAEPPAEQPAPAPAMLQADTAAVRRPRGRPRRDAVPAPRVAAAESAGAPVEAQGDGELPPGWVWTRIGEIAETTSGGTPSRKYVEYYGGEIAWVKSGELGDSFVNSVEEYITKEGLENSSAKIFPKGTTVVALYGATVGKTGILGIDAATNQAVCAIFPLQNSFIAKYMMYWLQYKRQHLINLSVGGAQPNISQGIVRALPFPLAPALEQIRVVAAIEEQLTRLDAGVAGLRAAQARLKRYRASVLKAACEGRLVPQDPSDEPTEALLARVQGAGSVAQGRKGRGRQSSFLETEQADAAELPELPRGWVWTSFGNVGEIQGGIQKQPKRTPNKNAYPYLRVANVMRGNLDLSEVHEMELFEGELERLRLSCGDLLIVEGNGSQSEIGRCALWNGEIENCVHQNHIIRVRFKEILSSYVSFFLNSPTGIAKMMSVASSTSGLHTLSVAKVKAIYFPLPPLAEQRRIVAEVERRLSVAGALEAALAANLRRAERLRQAILRRAFAGRLVPQDPSDEPAAALLARIRGGRGADTDNADGRGQAAGQRAEQQQMDLAGL